LPLWMANQTQDSFDAFGPGSVVNPGRPIRPLKKPKKPLTIRPCLCPVQLQLISGYGGGLAQQPLSEKNAMRAQTAKSRQTAALRGPVLAAVTHRLTKTYPPRSAPTGLAVLRSCAMDFKCLKNAYRCHPREETRVVLWSTETRSRN